MKELSENKERVIELLKEVLNRHIKNVEFEASEQFNSIIEYNFSILKSTVFYEDGTKDEIYLRLIKGGKIKESIFCYWSLLYEEYLTKKEQSEEEAVQKAIITQVTSEKNRSCILLTLDSKLNYSAEINLIELRKFYEKNIKYERWLDSLEIKYDDILFIGKKMY